MAKRETFYYFPDRFDDFPVFDDAIPLHLLLLIAVLELCF